MQITIDLDCAAIAKETREDFHGDETPESVERWVKQNPERLTEVVEAAIVMELAEG